MAFNLPDFSFLGKSPLDMTSPNSLMSIPGSTFLSGATPPTPASAASGFDITPGMLGLMANIGSIYANPKTPLGQVGTAVAQTGQTMQMNELLKKLMGGSIEGAAGGGGSALGTLAMMNMLSGGKSPFPGSPTLNSADVIGLTPDIVKSAYGTALTNKNIEGENLGRMVSALGTAATMSELPSKIAGHEAYSKYLGDLGTAKATELKMKQDRQANYKNTLVDWETGESVMPEGLDKKVIPMLKGLDEGQGTSIIKELLREAAATKKAGIKTYHFADQENLFTVNSETGDVIKKMPIKVREPKEAKDPATQVGLIEKGYMAAVTNNGAALKADFLKRGGNEKGFARLMMDLSDPAKATQAWSGLTMGASPELLNKLYREANSITQSLGAGRGFPEIPTVPPNPGRNLPVFK